MKEAHHAAVSFGAGSSVLTDADRAILRKLVRDSRTEGTIHHIIVAAWSDKGVPRVGQKLLDTDRKLASDRMDTVQDFLKTLEEGVSVEAYNMAESASWLARTFHTREAELKSVFGKTGGELPVSREAFQIFKREGGPCIAVAVVEVKKSEDAFPKPLPTPIPMP
jgi:hypothetical protein